MGRRDLRRPKGISLYHKDAFMSTYKSIAKSAGIISAGTIFSRILGFIRDILIAGFFGTGIASQAFVVAFRLPNLFRDLVAEGAVNSAFVPVFSEYLVRKKERDFWDLTRAVLVILLFVLTAIAFLGVIGAPWLVRIIAPGFIREPQKLELTIRLSRILFPYLILVGLAAYSMGILHTFKSFFAPAFGPAVLNLTMIASILLAVRYYQAEPIILVGFGVLLGELLQILIQLPILRHFGWRISLKTMKPDMRHPGVKQIGTLLGPRVFGSAIYQLNVLVDTVMASLGGIVGEGAVAAIYYANRIIQFPLAIFGIALSSAVLPTLSQQASSGDYVQLRRTAAFSLKAIYFVMLPASLGLAILAGPVITILFQRGRFDAYSTQITSLALLFYSLGLLAFAGVKILVSCFYSLQDTRTPVKVSFLALIINAVLNIILMFPLKVGGLALASAISATLNASMLYFILKGRIGSIIDAQSASYFFKVTLSAMIMAALTYFGWRILSGSSLPAAAALVIIIAASAFIYWASCLILKVKEVRQFSKWLFPKKNT
jgi:putative peptidoglycan lipid II flippase